MSKPARAVSLNASDRRRISAPSGDGGPPVSSNPKDLLGIAKPGIEAVPASALFHLGRAMAEGRGKYGLYNWRETAVQSDVYFNAMMRHAWAWNDGEELADGPLKCHHLAHVMACAAILLDGQNTGMLIDNRGTPGKLGQLIKAWTEPTKKD